MKKYIITTTFLIALFTLSCNNTSKHSSQDKESTIELNNGQKWKVNAEMKPYIEQGGILLNDYLAQNKSNYQVLAKELKTQNNSLIKSCTMKGESHDELHKWLHPHMQLIKNLSNASDTEEAQEVVTQIDNSFKLYNNYFE